MCVNIVYNSHVYKQVASLNFELATVNLPIYRMYVCRELSRRFRLRFVKPLSGRNVFLGRLRVSWAI